MAQRANVELKSEPQFGTANCSRVTYQGITYSICKSCYEVIGSGRTETTLLAIERFHSCSANA